ncbi:LOW QUALITY PROTEIN: uncharacterized protein QC761_0024560 [Podospora bellae-mahoneyi]|uniref:Uncharacterized protein n=1 Tax=Podospora bellae-mahoneyi TaxID=2093777 RepID=A0ABR0FV33_9PEZI|nr:LOW QUALITY PROTEIN: hypothetical protein QC761_0024560 [Podospora bellae-mahoneyi]
MSRIMEDPDVTVNVHAAKGGMDWVAGSLKAPNVRYYPQLDLEEGRSLELDDEPYAVIGHHLSSRKAFVRVHGRLKQAPNSIPEVASEPGADDDEDLNARQESILDCSSTISTPTIPAERSLHQRNLCNFGCCGSCSSPAPLFTWNFEVTLRLMWSNRWCLIRYSFRPETTTHAIHKIRLWSLTYDGRFVGRSSTGWFFLHLAGSAQSHHEGLSVRIFR